MEHSDLAAKVALIARQLADLGVMGEFGRVPRVCDVAALEFELVAEDEFTFIESFKRVQAQAIVVNVVECQAHTIADLNHAFLLELVGLELGEHFRKELARTGRCELTVAFGRGYVRDEAVFGIRRSSLDQALFGSSGSSTARGFSVVIRHPSLLAFARLKLYASLLPRYYQSTS